MKLSKHIILPFLICALFFLLYSLLGIIRHLHFQSGYDFAVVDQAIWKYSKFKAPISTNITYAFTPLLWDHVELTFPLISPIYWFTNNPVALFVLQSLVATFSGMAIFLLAVKKKVIPLVSYALLISYLMFYGMQFALWSDVHSLVFAEAALAFFIYFLEIANKKWATVFFLLAILSKEDVALLTFLISGIVFVKTKKTEALWYALGSLAYLFVIFNIYFPHFVPGGYRFQNRSGMFSNLDLTNLYKTADKRSVFFYSLTSFGFLPFFAPLNVIPAFADIFKYFVLGNQYVSSAQGLFGHYRITLALLMIWPTIFSISKYKFLNKKYIAVYLLVCTFFVQYSLHLPLSYFAKRWFWTTPKSVSSMKRVLRLIPQNASLVTQINIEAQMSHRDFIFTLWPDTKTFKKNSPCGKPQCQWFRWVSKPTYLVVDTSTDWDTRYWLENREPFVEGLMNLEKEKIIKPIKRDGTTTLYKVLKNPSLQ